ncbi:hypothetical protein FSP39_013638 [Pinctada imbricata]|uniref:protein-tyrosine-phosphatase n=1 Tax=Pinctada imbricata TaxID=66713 RepID=A0AA88XS51_PINIB|nr:hypothetical protein FSP39_013638 [Pinctada imbricata]
MKYSIKVAPLYIYFAGPFTPDTVIDFWRMTWQYDIKQIVMLTNLIEGSTIKCLRYWPQDEDDFGPLHVKTEDEELYESHAVRTFQLQKGEEKRSVTQFHFTAWPDKGVPDDVMSVLNFREEVVKHCNYEEHGPMIVHCSAGIGRTGTFIALDYLLREGSSGPKIDVINCVSKMRQQRVCVIQTLVSFKL